MRHTISLAILAILLLPVPTLAPAASAAPNPGLDLDIITAQDAYEANVSDPSLPSVSFVVIVKNNGTLPILNVHISVSVNLGGTATVDPSDTSYIPYGGQATAVVSATLPNTTKTSLVGTLRIDGVCSGTGQVTQVSDYKQVVVTIRQWHSIALQDFRLSTGSPVEKDMMQVSSNVQNNGNGPASIKVAAFLDGRQLAVRADGVQVRPNDTIQLDAGDITSITATWKAVYGRHVAKLEAEEVGPSGDNITESLSRDARSASFFVDFNTRDWIPYFLVAGLIMVAVTAVSFRYRKRLAARFPRFGRAFRIKLPPPAEKLQRALGSQVRRARGMAAKIGQRPLPKYITGRVRSDIQLLRSRTIPKGPPPGPEEIEEMRPAEKGRMR
jgi:hypothetical protein